MSWNRKKSEPVERAAIDVDNYATSQEATPLPVIIGERRVALRWLSPIYDQRTIAIYHETPGKEK